MYLKEINYVVITPVRDEEKYLEYTIKSMIDQDIKPKEWVIVNDGSRDNTGNIIDKYSAKYRWIKGLHLEDRGYRKSGGGVIDAFYEGYKILADSLNFDFVVKLDGDLYFRSDFFRCIFSDFLREPNLGIAGGNIYHFENCELVIEKQPKFHVRGATKVYRRRCWLDIGGLMHAPGWDTIDEIKANQYGWITRSIEGLKVIHFRVTGTADGFIKSNIKYGYGSYLCGFHPLHVFIKAFLKLKQKPFLFLSFAYLYGYTRGLVLRRERIADKITVKYLQRQQLRNIFFLKSIWN